MNIDKAKERAAKLLADVAREEAHGTLVVALATALKLAKGRDYDGMFRALNNAAELGRRTVRLTSGEEGAAK